MRDLQTIRVTRQHLVDFPPLDLAQFERAILPFTHKRGWTDQTIRRQTRTIFTNLAAKLK
jgi:hypothetical protein